MGEARRRGSFEDRKAEAIKAGRLPEARKFIQRSARIEKANMKRAYQDYMRKLLKYSIEMKEVEDKNLS